MCFSDANSKCLAGDTGSFWVYASNSSQEEENLIDFQGSFHIELEFFIWKPLTLLSVDTEVWTFINFYFRVSSKLASSSEFQNCLSISYFTIDSPMSWVRTLRVPANTNIRFKYEKNFFKDQILFCASFNEYRSFFAWRWTS